jgi:polar amino acid transport system substrate-binding protein
MQSQLRIFLVLGLTLFCWTAPASAETLQGIRQRGRLVVAVKNNTRPLGFKDREGRLQGLEIDIAQRLSVEMLGQSASTTSLQENRVELVPVNNQDRLQVLFDRRVDVTIARLGVNRGRSRVVDFSQPYYQDGTGVLTNSNKIKKIADLAGQPVAVIQSSVSAYPLAEQVPGARLVPVGSYGSAKKLLDEGKVMAFVADYSLLVGWTQEFPQGYRLLAEKLTVESLAIAMPKGIQHRELRDFVAATLDRWKKEGWLAARISYWGL